MNKRPFDRILKFFDGWGAGKIAFPARRRMQRGEPERKETRDSNRTTWAGARPVFEREGTNAVWTLEIPVPHTESCEIVLHETCIAIRIQRSERIGENFDDRLNYLQRAIPRTALTPGDPKAVFANGILRLEFSSAAPPLSAGKLPHYDWLETNRTSQVRCDH